MWQKFNVTKFLKQHPGGSRIIQQFAGSNCGFCFNSTLAAHQKIMKKFLIGTVQCNNNFSESLNRSQNQFQIVRNQKSWWLKKQIFFDFINYSIWIFFQKLLNNRYLSQNSSRYFFDKFFFRIVNLGNHNEYCEQLSSFSINAQERRWIIRLWNYSLCDWDKRNGLTYVLSDIIYHFKLTCVVGQHLRKNINKKLCFFFVHGLAVALLIAF